MLLGNELYILTILSVKDLEIIALTK